MTTLRQLGANSALYATTTLLQKGAAFLLMPLYTLYLDPAAYGTLAIVTAVNGFLSIAFTLGLTGAVTRFYFEYRDDPQTLAEFWGSILMLVMLLSAVVGGILLLVGERLLRPFIGAVPFWPYVALGVLTTIVQPFFMTFLTVLQTRNQAGRYAIISLAHFVFTALLTIALVVFLRWGVEGALVAVLAATTVFFALSLWLMRADLRFCLRWQHLRAALAYGLPQVPHLLAFQTTATADRLILNSRLGTATAGLYSVGAMISMAVDVAAASVNRAYVPLSMSALKSANPAELSQLQAMGSVIVAGFCLMGASVGAFGHELLRVVAAPAFAGAAPVVPILVFGGVINAIYYLFVNVLFFDRNAVKLLPLGTLSGAALNVGLALTLIPRFGLFGAAAANLAAQVLATILIAAIARRFDPVKWDYGRYALVFASGFLCSLGLSHLHVGSAIASVVVKLGGLGSLAVVIGLVLWRRPFILLEAALRLLHCRPREAAALFMNTEATA